MEDFDKKIWLDKDRLFRFSIHNEYGICTTIHYSIKEEDGAKNLRFLRHWDYTFTSFYSSDKYNDLKINNYVIDKANPLYIPLMHLLRGENELIIDDDETQELNQNYMRIYFDGKNVNIEFINNLEEEFLPAEKFHVFIKNICADVRSKVDCFDKDTKERLSLFFNEITDKFLEEDVHQMTIEEYLLDNDLLTLDDTKVFVKKI